MTALFLLGAFPVAGAIVAVLHTPSASPVVLLGCIFMAGFLGTAAMFQGTEHWKRTCFGFGISLIMLSLSVLAAMELMSDECIDCYIDRVHTFPRGLYFLLYWTGGFALYGAVGGACKRLFSAPVGAIAFGLPGLLSGYLALPPLPIFRVVLLLATLPLGGLLFGLALGFSEERRDIVPVSEDTGDVCSNMPTDS